MYFKEPTTGYQLFGKINVSLACRKIAGWMIVSQYNTACKLFQGRFKYDFWIGNRTSYSSLTNLVFSYDTICPV